VIDAFEFVEKFKDTYIGPNDILGLFDVESAFHSMIHRACNLPLSDESFKKKAEDIKDTTRPV
jgi:hypothetical protein